MMCKIRVYLRVRKPEPVLSFAENLQHTCRRELNPVSLLFTPPQFPTHLQLYSCTLSLQMQKGLLCKPLGRFQYRPHPACPGLLRMLLLLTCLHRSHRDCVLNNFLTYSRSCLLSIPSYSTGNYI